MPKRPRKSEEEKVPTWNEILPKLQKMSKEDIINCISKSWDDTNHADVRLDIVEHIKRSEKKKKATAKLLWVRWTDLEDKVLRTAVEVHGENFQYISNYVFNGSRTEKQCRTRWERRQKKTNDKWTKEEDDIIIRHLSSGNRSWAEIARELEGRTGYQVKQRYLGELDPNLKKGVWSADEMKILIDSQKELGNKWLEIAKRLPVSIILFWL